VHAAHTWLIGLGGVLITFLPGLALNHNLPDLCLLSSRAYRPESPRLTPNSASLKGSVVGQMFVGAVFESTFQLA
jgi:hypothetical protein